MLGESRKVGPLAPAPPWPRATMNPVAVKHFAADAKDTLTSAGVWLGTATSLDGLYRADMQDEGERWVTSLAHPPFLDYRLQDDPEYDLGEWPECTEVGTWADWVLGTIHKQPGYLDVWKEIAPEPTIRRLYDREFSGLEAGPLLRRREFTSP